MSPTRFDWLFVSAKTVQPLSAAVYTVIERNKSWRPDYLNTVIHRLRKGIAQGRQQLVEYPVRARWRYRSDHTDTHTSTALSLPAAILSISCP